jgi:superfamily I DNA/RNA helicase
MQQSHTEEKKSMTKKTKEAKSTFTPEQIKFIKHNGPESILLTATAGSGKTSCATGRLIWLLNRKVRPEKIIFFSFTNDAVDELRSRINNDKVEITTIHSFCLSALARSGKFKNIADFHGFIRWFKKKHKPKTSAKWEEITRFNRMVEKLEEEPEYYASQISKFKIMQAENTKGRMPDFFIAYTNFLKATNSRDFVDMLIEVHRMKDGKYWENNYQHKYDYVFVDEYQDTSSMQMRILLALKAKIYHLIGDRNQSIYGFTGSNCSMIEKLLKQAKPTVDYSLSTNFRSDIDIVNNSNHFSDLKAIPNSKLKGKVDFKILSENELFKMMGEKEVVILARTNKVIRDLELKFLIKKIPMRYFNLFTEDELEIIKKKKAVTPKLNRKLKKILPKIGRADDMVKFIEENEDSKTFVTSIHKSKGREFPVCVVVNSISPHILEKNGIELDAKELKKVSFDMGDPEDQEALNVHYVAVTRAKNELYFMIYDMDEL